MRSAIGLPRRQSTSKAMPARRQPMPRGAAGGGQVATLFGNTGTAAVTNE